MHFSLIKYDFLIPLLTELLEENVKMNNWLINQLIEYCHRLVSNELQWKPAHGGRRHRFISSTFPAGKQTVPSISRETNWSCWFTIRQTDSCVWVSVVGGYLLTPAYWWRPHSSHISPLLLKCLSIRSCFNSCIYRVNSQLVHQEGLLNFTAKST